MVSLYERLGEWRCGWLLRSLFDDLNCFIFFDVADALTMAARERWLMLSESLKVVIESTLEEVVEKDREEDKEEDYQMLLNNDTPQRSVRDSCESKSDPPPPPILIIFCHKCIIIGNYYKCLSLYPCIVYC